MNECQAKDHGCDKNAVCINLAGSHECRCRTGFGKLKHEGPCVENSYLEDEDGETMMQHFANATFYHLYLVLSPPGKVIVPRIYHPYKRREEIGGTMRRIYKTPKERGLNQI